MAQMLPIFAEKAVAETKTAQSPGLQRLLEGELKRFPSTSGVYVKSLRTGEEASVNGDTPFEGASTIKVAIMVYAYRLAEQHKLDLNERMVLTASDYVGGTGVFRYHSVGLNPTIRDLLTEMIITSDNIATDMVLRKVGGVDAVNAFLESQGFHQLRANRSTFDEWKYLLVAIDPKYQSLTHEDVFELCCATTVIADPPKPSATQKALITAITAKAVTPDFQAMQIKFRQSPKNWISNVTPREMGKLLERIESGTAASPSSCDEMKRIMLNTQASGSAIAGALKLHVNIPVAFKRGGSIGLTNDVGILYAHSGPIIVAFYNMNATVPVEDIEEKMGRVTQLIVEYFDGRS
jgi:beta-lactamase class A